MKRDRRKASEEPTASTEGCGHLGGAAALEIQEGIGERFKKNPQDLGWMCGVREKERSWKSLDFVWDNLVGGDVIY